VLLRSAAKVRGTYVTDALAAVLPVAPFKAKGWARGDDLGAEDVCNAVTRFCFHSSEDNTHWATGRACARASSALVDSGTFPCLASQEKFGSTFWRNEKPQVRGS
jgi:hypothetical protein